jgi:hypothetical protein
MGNSNLLMFDESLLSLTAGNGPGNHQGPAIGCPAIASGTHDNVDALNFQPFDTNGDRVTDRWLYWSLNPDAAWMQGMLEAEIYDIAPGGGPVMPGPAYAQPWQMGLNLVGEDDIDGLIVWDQAAPGGPAWGGPGAEPQLDYALFSLSHGSATLAQWGLSPGDIFFTDFNGSFALYASAIDLGLNVAAGAIGSDNVDALTVLAPGDATLDGRIDVSDLARLAGNWGMAGGAQWWDADFTGDGNVNVSDLAVLAGNWNMSTEPMPEPTTLGLLALGAVAMLARRKR